MTKNKSYLLGFCFLAIMILWLMAGVSPLMGQDSLENSEVQNAESTAVVAGEAEEELVHDHDSDVAAQEEPQPPGMMYFLLSNKYIAIFVLMVAGLVLLFGKWINLWVRIAMMVVAFILFGLDLVFPLHPSPMCATTKLFMFKFTWGAFFPAFLSLFLIIMVPSIFGRKLFCGWVCPLGAFQELINKIPFKPRWKNFNFTAFNSVRLVLLALFFISFFWLKDMILYLGQEAGADTTNQLWTSFSAYSIYEPINFFELLHWQVSTLWIIMMIVLVVSSLMIYRPFCYSICPLGALTWLLEKIAPGRIRIDYDKCNECGTCEEESPCPTIKPLVADNYKLLPDCTSCGECIKSCPEDAISFKLID
jgi:polyferredoxin